MSFSVYSRMALEAVDSACRELLTENGLTEYHLDIDRLRSTGQTRALVDLYLHAWNWREIKDRLDTK
jgi:hypothetical protein